MNGNEATSGAKEKRSVSALMLLEERMTDDTV